MSRPRLIETEKYYGCRDRDRSRLGKRCRDRDSIESLADLWYFMKVSIEFKEYLRGVSRKLQGFLRVFQDCFILYSLFHMCWRKVKHDLEKNKNHLALSWKNGFMLIQGNQGLEIILNFLFYKSLSPFKRIIWYIFDVSNWIFLFQRFLEFQ